MTKLSKIFVRFLSMLLVICTVCTVLPQNFKAQTQTSNTEEIISYYDGNVVPLGEIVSLREENVKHFRMSDGSVVAATYDVPVHTLEDGEWVDIDNTLSEVSSELQTNNQRIKFAKKINGSKKILTLHDGNKKIEFSMPSAVKNTVGVATNLDNEDDSSQTELQKMMTLNKVSASVRYDDISDGIDLEYIVVSNTIKENIIVNEKADSYEYEFSLKLSNLEAVAAENGDVLLMDGEDAYYTIPAPFMIDANGVYSEEVSYALSGSNGSYILTVTADSAWMNDSDRAYPVKIDPTVSTRNDSGLDVTSGYIASNKQTFVENSIIVGNSSSAEYRAYWRLSDLPILPENSVITSGTFAMDCNYLSNASTSDKITMSKVISNWDVNTLNWSTKETYGAIDDDILDYVVAPQKVGTFLYWDLLDTLKSWYEGTEYNYGLCFSAETSAGSFYFYSNTYSLAALRPTLTIGYISDTGIDENRTYHETSISSNASAYIDYTSGYLKVLLSEIFCEDDENTWPVELVYNASQLATSSELTNAYIGNYWRLGIDETVVQNATDTSVYNFIDSTGAIHYMKLNSEDGLYYDTVNAETTLTIQSDGSYEVSYNGETHKFTSGGVLSSIVFDENALTFVRTADMKTMGMYLNNAYDKAIDFSYDSAGFLTSITSQDTEKRQGLRFTYTDSVLTSIEVMDDEGTYEATYAFAYDSNGNLTQITNLKDNIRATYTYETSILKRVITATEEKYSGENSTVTNSYIFRYETGATYVYEPGANGVFDNVSVLYGHVNVVNLECDDIVTAYIYDNNYRMIQTYSENITGSEFYSGAIYTYDDKGNVKRITNIQDNRNVNYINAPSFTTLPETNGNTTYTYELDNEVSKLGVNSVKITGTESSAGEASVKIYPEKLPIGKAVFSCYVKTENVTGEVFARVTNAYNTATTGETVHLTGTTAEDVGNGWQRVFFTFEVQNDINNVIELVMNDSAGIAYFDGFQLDANCVTPSVVSRLTNSSGSKPVGIGWEAVNGSIETYEGEETFCIEGNKTSVNTLSQTVTMNTGIDEMYVLSGLTKAASAHATNTETLGQPVPIYRILTEVTLTDGTNTWTQAPQVTDLNKDNRNWQYFSHPVFVDKSDETYDYTNAKVVSVKITLDYSYNANTAWFKEMTFTRTSALDFAYDEDGEVISMSIYYVDTNNDETIETIEKPSESIYENTETVYDEAGEYILYTRKVDDKGNIVSNTRYSYNDDYSLILSEITYEGSTDNGRILEAIYNNYDNGNNLIKIEKYTAVGALSQRTVTEYDANGNVTREIDVNGVVKTYQYDSEDRLIYETTGDYRKVGYVYTDDSDKVSYTYYDLNGNGTFDADVDKRICYTYDGEGNLTLIDGNTDYTLSYDLLGQKTAVKVGAIENFVTYTYSGHEGNLTSMSYLNGYTENYEYDNNNNVTKLWKKTSSTASTILSYEWVYNVAGLLYKEFDYELNRTTHYEYDADGGLIRTYTIDADGKVILQIEYPQKGSVERSVRYIIDGVILDEIDVRADEENNTTTITSHTGIVTTTTDDLGRVIGSILQTTDDFALMESYSYLNVVMTPGKADTSSSTYVSTLTMADGTVYGYSYDSIGNITRVTENGVLKLSYQYDGQGQLVREDNVYANATYAFTYDGYGNILSKSTYGYMAPDTELPTTAVSTNTYSYGNVNWSDQLTEYNGVTITYDEIGNPLSYYNGKNYTFTWEGRQLATVTDGTNSYSYMYNSYGVRVEKVANSVVHKYTIDGTKILAETYGDTTLNFYYDENDSPIAFSVNGTMYYYGKNLQGDVVKLYTANGEVIAEYTYDAWGKLLAITDANGNAITAPVSPAVVNPIRYRGYYYDSETGLYYLSSRYYDAIVGRFINIDDPVILFSYNVGLNCNGYVYCDNNPTNYVDNAGYYGTPVQWVCAVIGGVSGWFFGDYIARSFGYKPSGKGFWNATKYWAIRTGVIIGGAAVGWFAGTAILSLAKAYLVQNPLMMPSIIKKLGVSALRIQLIRDMIKLAIYDAASIVLTSKKCPISKAAFQHALYGNGKKWSSSALNNKVKKSNLFLTSVKDKLKNIKTDTAKFPLTLNYTSKHDQDLYLSIGKFEFNVTGTKKNGKWNLHVSGTNEYDFDNIRLTSGVTLGNAANDFGLLLQKTNMLKPFSVYISFDITI